MTIDSILNWVVPIAIFTFLGMVIYGKQKDSIDRAVDTIKGWFVKKKEEVLENTQDESILTYR